MNKQVSFNLFIVLLLLAVVCGIAYIFLRPSGNPQKVINTEIAVSNALTASSTSGSIVLQTPNESSTTTQIKKNKHMISIETNLGTIVFETYDLDAPKTVENFITLAKKDYYNGVIFHRVIKGFMIQGGDPTGTGSGGPGYQFADELNPNTASYKNGYKKGIVAMANAGPNTNGSQFFIMLADYPLPNNYTIFGRVVSGQEVVDKIGQLPTGAQDRPTTPPVIKKVIVQ